MKINTIELTNQNECSENIEAALAACEKTIQHGLGTFIEVGSALLIIRNEQLYRRQYRNFDEYCKKRWSFGKSHANRLVNAAQATHELAPIGAISHESQIRPLLRLEPAKQQEAWREALKINPAPTEWQVRMAVQKVVPVKKNAAPFPASAASPESAPAPARFDYEKRCEAFVSLGMEEVRDLISESDSDSMKAALFFLRDGLDHCYRILQAGRR